MGGSNGFFVLAAWLRQCLAGKGRLQLTHRQCLRVKLQVEQLESRCIPTVTSSVAAGVLIVTGKAADTIVVSAAGGEVQVNGADPGSGPAAASSILKIVVSNGPGSSLDDLTNVRPTDFTALAGITVNTGPGTGIVKLNTEGNSTILGTKPILIEYDSLPNTALNNVVEDPYAGTIAFGNGKSSNFSATLQTSNIFLNLNMANLTIEPGPGNKRIIEDGPNPGNGVSQAFNASNGSSTYFRNPTRSFTLDDIHGTADQSLYEFRGLDRSGRPPIVTFNTENSLSNVQFTGNAANVVENLAANTVSLDGLKVNIPGSGPGNLFMDERSVYFTLILGSSNHRVIEDVPTSGDPFNNTPGLGVSRAYNASNNTFSDFRNPSRSLTVEASGGHSIINFEGLDRVRQPSRVTLEGSFSGKTHISINLTPGLPIRYHLTVGRPLGPIVIIDPRRSEIPPSPAGGFLRGEGSVIKIDRISWGQRYESGGMLYGLHHLGMWERGWPCYVY